MPLYDYLCTECGPFDMLRSLRERTQAPCPRCGTEAPQAVLHAPRLGLLTAGQRQAHAINERSAHAPRSSRDDAQGGSYGRLRHPAGCGCCTLSSGLGRSGSTAGSQASQPTGLRMKTGARPWMISH